VKDGLGARMYSVQKFRLYESQMSESRGLPVLCLVTLKINKFETVALKSLWGVYSWNPFMALCWDCRWHCCVPTDAENGSHLGENLVQATWHCDIPGNESVQADQRAGHQFTLQHNNFEHLPSDISSTVG